MLQNYYSKENLLVLRHPSGYIITTSPQVEALGNINPSNSKVSLPFYKEVFLITYLQYKFSEIKAIKKPVF